MKQNKTRKFSVWMNVGQIYLVGIASFLAYFQVNQMLAVYLDVDQFAQYHLTLRVTFLLSNILILGQPLTVRTFLSRALGQGDEAQAHAVLRWVLLKVRNISGIILGLLLVSISVFACVPDVFGGSLLARYPSVFLLINLPIMLLVNLLPALLDVFHCFKFSRITQSILSYFIYFVMILLHIRLGFELTNTVLISSFTLSQICVLFIVLIKLKAPLLRIYRAPCDVNLLETNQLSDIAKQGFLANVSYQVAIHFSVLCIGFLSSEENIVANYSAIMIVVSLFFTLSEFLRGYLSQRMMELRDQGQLPQARRLLIDVSILNAIGTLIFLAIGWLYADVILKLFGNDFAVNRSLLQFGLLINAGLNFLAPVWSLIEYAYPHENAKYCILQLVITIGLLVISVPFLGIVGALLTDVVAELIVLAMLFNVAWRKYGFFASNYQISLAHLQYND